MAIPHIYRFYGMVFTGVQFGGTTNLGGMSTTALSPNAQVIQDYTDGNPHPSRTTIQAFQEDLSFTTLNIDAALSLIGAISQCIEDGSTIDLYYAKFTECSAGPAAGLVHKKVTITQTGTSAGLIHAGSLNCDHRGDASFSFMIKPKSDGTNSPIVITDNVALPAGVFDNKNRYSIGPVSVAGSTIDGLKSVGVDFGISVTRESVDSNVFDEFIGLEKTASKISLSGINLDWWTSLGLTGIAATHANTSVIFRRRLVGAAGFEGAAAEMHVILSAAGLAVPSNYASTSEQGPAEAALDVYCDYDGTNVPILVQIDSDYL